MPANARRELENVMRHLLKRCVLCEDAAPTCEGLKCSPSESCIQTPKTCDACPFVRCMPQNTDPTISNVASHKGPNVGAIAGGVVGGVVIVAAIVFVVWKFCLKGRRRTYEEGEWQEVDMTQQQEKVDSDFVSRRSTRASTHTVASMASSVLTRASNIIQIAYIPGVTNRSGPGSPDFLVPPVPPIPAMSPSSGFSTPYSASDQHFFVPDFRDSMASGTTDSYSTYARTSIAPSLARTSVASTVYRQNAIVSPLPAQTIVRGKAAVVSVKSTGSNSPTGMDTPPVPQIDPKHSATPIRIQMPSMTSTPSSGLSRENSIRSTATLGKVRALNITKKKASDVTPPKSSGSTASSSLRRNNTPDTPDTMIHMRPFTEISIDSTDDDVAHSRARRTGNDDSDSDSDGDDHSRAHRSLLRNSDITEIHDTPTSLQSPFSDSSASDYSRPDMPQRHTSTSSGLRSGPPMTPIREESSKRASHASARTQSPFSDDNKSDL